MKKVLIVYKFLPEYRIDFYNILRDKLFDYGIELHLMYGKFDEIDALRKNEVEIEWASLIANKRYYFGKKIFTWQPALKFLSIKT